MDDKRFNEIMNQYVASKSRGKEVDFRKLNEKEEQALQKRKQLKIALSTIPIVLVIIVTLAISLPLILKDANDVQSPTVDLEETPTDDTSIIPPSNNYYFGLNNYEREMVTLESLSSTYEIVTPLPTIACMEKSAHIIKTGNDAKVIGVFLEFSIYDADFDALRLYIIPENNVIQGFEIYEQYRQETEWNNNIVKLYVQSDEEDGSNLAKIYFKLGEYKYYLDVVYYGELDIPTVLDLIF